MELFQYYLRYLAAVCEGSLQVPGLSAEGRDETEKAKKQKSCLFASKICICEK